LVFVSDREDGKWTHVFLASLDKDGPVQLEEFLPDDMKPADAVDRYVRWGRQMMREVGIGIVTQYKKIEAVPFDVSGRALDIFLRESPETLGVGELDVVYRYIRTAGSTAT
jgi:hypothetical protein